ncbi:ATP-binding protein [uncultured Aureimonas sp.]|uniref:sensor histidine kinase n=1 Tax=uncultured Aureimonas sp. TaxID=1604662 RepID=UPI0025E54B77|nr:ATP-binding protein [uncultured Aureimonas sp.]
MLLAVLSLPLASLVLFRFYENQLIRQTEAELIAQGAALGAVFAQELHDDPVLATLPVAPAAAVSADPGHGRFRPVEPALDLADDPILSPRPLARAAARPSPLADKGAGMTDILIATQRSTLTGFRLLDPWGTVIAGADEVGMSLDEVDEVHDALSGRYRSVLRRRVSDEPTPPLYSISRGARLRVFVAMPVVSQDRLVGVVYLSRTPNNILRHLYVERGKLALAGLAMGGATIAIAFVFMRTIGRPIYELRRRTARIAAGDVSALQPLRRQGTREMAELSDAFLDMARELEGRSDAIRVFATHLSHELKSPLTAIRGAVELVRDEGMDMEDPTRRRFLDNVLADTDRLVILVRRLIELTRAESLMATNEATSVEQALSTLGPRMPLPIDLDAAAQMPLAISTEALGIVLANLFDNAARHGATRMGITVERQGGQVRIGVCDDGTGISEANRDRIFQPFFTTRRESGGTGLGLGIVVALLKAYHGTIRLDRAETGSRFIIELPFKTGFLPHTAPV